MVSVLSPSPVKLHHADRYWVASFEAMASPCYVFIESKDERMVKHLASLAAIEASRIEHKFSRYRSDNVVYEINNAKGQSIRVDEETALLLDYAQQCYELSEGLFDITSGVLRKAWRFNESSVVPESDEVVRLLSLVGWDKVIWKNPYLQLKPGMEIDLGGVGKEYAVDRSALLIAQHFSGSVLINYGGDLCVTGSLANGEPWDVAIERISDQGSEVEVIKLSKGAVATSGDSRRFILKDGKRYGHIINPLTGWPVDDAPRSITVTAETCLQAGMLSTFAMLQGKDAEIFLEEQGVEFHVYR